MVIFGGGGKKTTIVKESRRVALIVIDSTHRYENINAGVCIYPLCKHLESILSLTTQAQIRSGPRSGLFSFR
jgi:hypothetical protein